MRLIPPVPLLPPLVLPPVSDPLDELPPVPVGLPLDPVVVPVPVVLPFSVPFAGVVLVPLLPVEPVVVPPPVLLPVPLVVVLPVLPLAAPPVEVLLVLSLSVPLPGVGLLLPVAGVDEDGSVLLDDGVAGVVPVDEDVPVFASPDVEFPAPDVGCGVGAVPAGCWAEDDVVPVFP